MNVYPDRAVARWLAPVVRMAVTVLPLALWACDDASRGSERSSDPAVWGVASEPLITIGEIEAAPEYMFSSVTAARFLPDGRLLVADRGPNVVRIYQANGAFEQTMGGEGTGPGEFRFLSGVAVTAPGGIVALDLFQRRVTRFHPDGTLGSTAQLVPAAEEPLGSPDVLCGSLEGGDAIVSWTRGRAMLPDQPVPDEVILTLVDPDGSIDAVLAREDGLLRLGGSPVHFSPFPLCAVRGEHVYFTNGSGASITVRDRTGTTVGSIPLPPGQADPAEAWSALEEELVARGDAAWITRLEGAPRDGELPVVSDMFADSEGRLWVKRFAPVPDAVAVGRRRTGGEWVALDPSGVVVASLEVPDGFRLTDVREDRVLGVVLDELDVARVQVYRVEVGT